MSNRPIPRLPSRVPPAALSRGGAPGAPSRRGVLGALAATAGAGLLAGCGFQLRQAPNFPFRSIAVPGNTLLVNLLRRQLQAQGNVEVLKGEEAEKTAEVVCKILSEDRSRGIAASTSGGQIRELTLGLNVRFSLTTREGKALIAPTEISQSRDISFNETAALAKEGEEALLYRDMTGDIAQQILRRLGAVKGL